MRLKFLLPLLVSLVGLFGPGAAARAGHCGSCRFPVWCAPFKARIAGIVAVGS